MCVRERESERVREREGGMRPLIMATYEN